MTMHVKGETSSFTSDIQMEYRDDNPLTTDQFIEKLTVFPLDAADIRLHNNVIFNPEKFIHGRQEGKGSTGNEKRTLLRVHLDSTRRGFRRI